jgi:rhamnose utilization protein RhaD (predicted bifunctional aldolase and dehydrogenase)
MDARAPGEENKRPSVETLMHDLFPYSYVLHTHPSRINGLTCGSNGKQRCLEIFPDALWVPIVNPGYILATVMRQAAETYLRARGSFPSVVFLENHGLVVAGDDPEATKAAKERVMETVASHITREPDLSETAAEIPEDLLSRIAASFRDLTAEDWVFELAANAEISRLVADREAFGPVSGPFSPDHVVYSGHKPLFVTPEDARDRFASVLAEYQRAEGTLPKTVAVQGIGALGCGATEKLARSARLLFVDAVKIAVYTESFGGPQFLPPDQIEFIRGWEVEKYRERVSRE